MTIESGRTSDLSLSKKNACDITTTCAKKKTDKNMKRLCKIYGQISTDFYRETMPISKIHLNLKFLTKLDCGVRIEVPRQAIYAFSKGLIYKIHLLLQNII